jgi:uncharacterized protein (UPF0212 family)
MADCQTCLDFIDNSGGNMDWVKTMSFEELNKCKAKIKVFKCPSCGGKVDVIYLVKPK